LRIVGIGADGGAADQYLGQLAGVVPCVGVRAIIGDVAGGIVGVAVAANGGGFIEALKIFTFIFPKRKKPCYLFRLIGRIILTCNVFPREIWVYNT